MSDFKCPKCGKQADYYTSIHNSKGTLELYYCASHHEIWRDTRTGKVQVEHKRERQEV